MMSHIMYCIDIFHISYHVYSFPPLWATTYICGPCQGKSMLMWLTVWQRKNSEIKKNIKTFTIKNKKYVYKKF